VHSPSQLLFDLPKGRLHAIAPCDPLHEELPTTVAFADEGKAEEVEGLRLAEPTLSASFRCKAAEFNQAGLVPVERQCKFPQPLSLALRPRLPPRIRMNTSSKSRLTVSQSTGKALAEFPTSTPQRFIGHNDAPPSHQQFHIA